MFLLNVILFYGITLFCINFIDLIEAKPLNFLINARAVLTLNEETYWEQVNKTCLAHDCDEHVNLKHLQHIATHMNRAINPCDNFHAYACSYWQQEHPKQLTVMAEGEQLLIDKYEAMFQDNENSLLLKNNDALMQKLKKYYGVCLNSERDEKASWLQYINTLRRLGYLQWSNTTDWLQAAKELNQFSNSRYFISLQVWRANSSHFMLSIDPHFVKQRAKLSQDIYDILTIYTNASFKEIENDFHNLEMDLENILNSSCLNAIVDESDECDLSQWLSYENLLASNTTMDWKYFLSNVSLERTDQIYFNDFISLEKIKNYLDHSNQKTLFLYAIARFINFLQSHSYNTVEKGSESQNCLRHMRKNFPLAMNYLYEQVYYKAKRQQSDQVISQIFAQLKEQFSLILDTNEMQLSQEAIEYLRKKLMHLELNIGNLPKNASIEFYQDFIKDLEVGDNFYENHLYALKHFFLKQRLLASCSKFEDFWFTFNLHMPYFADNVDSTPYYLGNANFIILPFAYLQLPFYDYRFWPSLLYGDLANTLGHELIHAFDSKFIHNDYAGNYNDEKESAHIINNTKFQQSIACLSEVPTNFLSERIADISGTHLALKTFVKDPLFLKHNGKLFFLQFAQFFCGSAAEDKFALEDSSHDLDSLRLNYTLAHMPEFAETFQCPLGSPMNPAKKCKLW